MLQAAGTDPIRPLFVFLDLLKSNAQVFAKLLLAHPKHHPTKTDPTSDMNVYRVRLLLIGH
jgi:hypothetical protein